MTKKIFNLYSPDLIAKQNINRVEKLGAFISYAQHGEDVLLNRAFKNKKKGKFIDIGANHPVKKSVTYSFYIKGWQGLNIDVDKESIKKFKIMRPRDNAICVAASDKNKYKKAYLMSGTTLSTLNNLVGAFYNKQNKNLIETFVNCETLSSILIKFKKFKNCDFLNIDVEGHELKVLQGINFNEFNTKVIVLEAIHPIDKTNNLKTFKSFLSKRGFVLALFDGLNAYFVNKKNHYLVKIFKTPPNYTDNFLKAETFVLSKTILKRKLK